MLGCPAEQPACSYFYYPNWKPLMFWKAAFVAIITSYTPNISAFAWAAKSASAVSHVAVTPWECIPAVLVLIKSGG